MTNTELKNIRLTLKWSYQDMANNLKIKKATYQTYEDARSKIPEHIAREAEATLHRNQKFDSTRIQRIDDWIQQEFPRGFLSEACEW